MKSYDYSVIGGGIVGLTLASRLCEKFPSAKIAVFEKEPSVGYHASGRNSGVLHSGIYYPPRTLKAKVCQSGARALEQFCVEHRIGFRRCGKVILPVQGGDNGILDLLAKRGRENGVESFLIGQSQLKEIEPLAHSKSGRALYIPFTAIFDHKGVLYKLVEILKARGVDIYFDSPALRVELSAGTIQTPSELFSVGHIFNAAGMQADIFATQCGIRDWVIFPFKGIYLRLHFPGKFRCLVYPVPDLRVPFLGTHFTMDLKDDVTLGPSALPAFGRENYEGLRGVDWNGLPRFAWMLFKQYLKNQQGFRQFAHRELLNLSVQRQIREAQTMVPSLKKEDLSGSRKVGIRAQLFNLKKQELEMDFVVVRQPKITHILNAVSPGFTSSFAFADHVLNETV